MLPLKRVEECRRTNAKFIVYNTHAMMSWQNKKINQLRLPLHSCYSLIHEVLFDIRGPSWTADGERVPRLLVGCQSSSDVCVCVCVCVFWGGKCARYPGRWCTRNERPTHDTGITTTVHHSRRRRRSEKYDSVYFLEGRIHRVTSRTIRSHKICTIPYVAMLIYVQYSNTTQSLIHVMLR